MPLNDLITTLPLSLLDDLVQDMLDHNIPPDFLSRHDGLGFVGERQRAANRGLLTMQRTWNVGPEALFYKDHARGVGIELIGDLIDLSRSAAGVHRPASTRSNTALAGQPLTYELNFSPDTIISVIHIRTSGSYGTTGYWLNLAT